jgi:hypothetical protein
VKLTVNGKTYTQTLNVRIDPRVVTPATGLAQQFLLSMQAYEGVKTSYTALSTIRRLKDQIKNTNATGELANALAAFEKKLSELDGSGSRPAPGAAPPVNFASVNSACLTLLDILQEGDFAPTSQAVNATRQATQSLPTLAARWAELTNKELPALNQMLQQNGKPLLTAGP